MSWVGRLLRRTLLLSALALPCVVGTAWWFSLHACGSAFGERRAADELGPCWLLPQEGMALAWKRWTQGDAALAPQYGEFERYQPIEFAQAIASTGLPQHPFLAAGGSNMHNDAAMSDVYAAAGPRGRNSYVNTRTQGFGGYGTLAFDRAGRIVAVYSNGGGFQLELMDPLSLQELATYDLPARPWYFPLQGVLPWKYIGAGVYFYLDAEDRAVVPTTHNTIEVMQVPRPGSSDGFELVRSYDLAPHVAELTWPRADSVAWVLPEWNGERYWFATLAGIVGTVDVASGTVRTLQLEGEIIENSFAVGADGVFIISDHALYRFVATGNGRPWLDWRIPYDRGPAQKPGHITRGSGSSVTLLGGSEGLVVVTDNAEPQIHVKFHRRSNGAEVCRVPLFAPGQSGTDLSVIAFEQDDAQGKSTGHYSALIENNWGHHSFPRPHPVPGLTRVDSQRQPDGSFTCDEVWRSQEKSLGVVKLSLGSGLAYMYGPDDTPEATGWYFTAIDFRTGETVFRQRSGFGHGFNNWQGALFLHPSNGTAYTTTIFGLVSLRDAAVVP